MRDTLGTQLPQGTGADQTGPWLHGAGVLSPLGSVLCFPNFSDLAPLFPLEATQPILLLRVPASGDVTGTLPTAPSTSAVPSPGPRPLLQKPPVTLHRSAAAGPSLAPLTSSDGPSRKQRFTNHKNINRFSGTRSPPLVLAQHLRHSPSEIIRSQCPQRLPLRGRWMFAICPQIAPNPNTLEGALSISAGQTNAPEGLASRWATREARGLGSGRSPRPVLSKHSVGTPFACPWCPQHEPCCLPSLKIRHPSIPKHSACHRRSVIVSRTSKADGRRPKQMCVDLKVQLSRAGRRQRHRWAHFPARTANIGPVRVAQPKERCP